jgi:hypothetical protein
MVLKMVIVTVDHWEAEMVPKKVDLKGRLKEPMTVLKKVDLKVVMRVKEMVLNLVLNWEEVKVHLTDWSSVPKMARYLAKEKVDLKEWSSVLKMVQNLALMKVVNWVLMKVVKREMLMVPKMEEDLAHLTD